MVKILGISASLRNARFGAGGTKLTDDLAALESRESFVQFLSDQTRILLEEFFDQGRSEGLDFESMYRRLRGSSGDRGLSNSEGTLAAALWGASREGAEIRYLGLGHHFRGDGSVANIDAVRDAILWADGIILSGPVYFGDRGSLAQSLVEFLHADARCRAHIRNKVYGGVTVGAKRNGGQETTLIYQLVDMTNLGMLAVGNGSETTSQYGGTAVAGDVGTIHLDDYGIETSISTGARVARVTKLSALGIAARISDPVRIGVWLLQDSPDHRGRELISELTTSWSSEGDNVEFEILDGPAEPIHRCIACDICPIDVGPPEEYRCIIKSKDDLFKKRHVQLASVDALLIAAYSPRDRRDILSVYQTFIERTRYLRRDHYLLGDLFVAPLVISEIGANQNLHIRILTSMVRHHTILHHALIGFEQDRRLLNQRRCPDRL